MHKYTTQSCNFFQKLTDLCHHGAYCRCLLGKQSFQSGYCFPGPCCCKDLRWTSMHTCAIVLSTYFQVGWKCLPSQLALIVSTFFKQTLFAAFFCELSLMTTVKHEQLCKFVSFWKKITALCGVMHIYAFIWSSDFYADVGWSNKMLFLCVSVSMAFVLSLMQGSHS